MKYKYPKKITIGDTTFKMIYDKHSDGASFSYPTDEEKAFIRIGMSRHKQSPGQFLNYIIHEVKEIIQVEQSTRLWSQGSGEYEFHYDHKEHSDLCSRLSTAISKFIK